MLDGVEERAGGVREATDNSSHPPLAPFESAILPSGHRRTSAVSAFSSQVALQSVPHPGGANEQRSPLDQDSSSQERPAPWALRLLGGDALDVDADTCADASRGQFGGRVDRSDVNRHVVHELEES